MTFRVAIFTLALLFILTASHSVYAVGYERYEVNGAQETQSKAKSDGAEGLAQAVKQATFVEKVPAVLDQVAFFVRDVLAQFGLKTDKNE